MAEVEKVGNKLIVECDCGAVHKITKEESGILAVSSTFKKPKKEEEDGRDEKKRKTEKKPEHDDFF